MTVIFLIILGLFSSIIFYQDYKTRSVVWPLFPCVLILGAFYSFYYTESLQKFVLNTGLNIGFFLLQIVLLKIVFGFKRIINHKLGIGDILFILCCCFFFSPLNFLVFYILSLLFSLCVYFLWLNKSQKDSIPLAGIQAVFLFFFITAFVIAGSNTTEDIILLSH